MTSFTGDDSGLSLCGDPHQPAPIRGKFGSVLATVGYAFLYPIKFEAGSGRSENGSGLPGLSRGRRSTCI